MKTLLAVVVAVVVTLLQAEGASAVPVELKFHTIHDDPDYHRFSGSISYNTDSFQNNVYDVALRTWQEPYDENTSYEILYYEGRSSYVQSAPSASIFRLEDYLGWFDFDINDFNSATNFINTITIETIAGSSSYDSYSRIVFESHSDKYSVWFENIHGYLAGIIYAQNRNIYDIPTAATEFWPSLGDDSHYYYYLEYDGRQEPGTSSPLTPVPEPGTVVLVGAGLLGLLPFARRRRREM